MTSCVRHHKHTHSVVKIHTILITWYVISRTGMQLTVKLKRHNEHASFQCGGQHGVKVPIKSFRQVALHLARARQLCLITGALLTPTLPTVSRWVTIRGGTYSSKQNQKWRVHIRGDRSFVRGDVGFLGLSWVLRIY